MDYSASVFTKACMVHGVKPNDELFLYSDNGGPMKGSIMQAIVQKLGVISSSRPKVSDDNLYSESLFTLTKGIR